MLLSLNDDCLLYICEFLNYSEQSSLAHSCKRLQTIVGNYWSHLKHVKLDHKQYWWFNEQNEEYFIEFIRFISKNVEDLRLEEIEPHKFRILNNFEFRKTTKAYLNLCCGKQYAEDEAINLILKLFPNLTKLSVYCCTLTGNNLWNLKNLNELEIGGCENLELKYFKKIFSTLHLRKLDIMFYGNYLNFDNRITGITECKTLEELFIDDHHLLLFIEDLVKLNKLKKLVVYTCDHDTYLLEEIVERYGNVMDTIIFDNVFWAKDEHLESVTKMHNLRKLKLHDDDIEGGQLKLIGKSLKNSLQSFSFTDGRIGNLIEEIEDGLTELISECKNLEFVDISYTKFNGNLLRKFIDKLSNDFKYRKKPLVLRCFDTNITAADAELLTIPGYFEISLEKVNKPPPESARTIQCEWVLTDAKSLC